MKICRILFAFAALALLLTGCAVHQEMPSTSFPSTEEIAKPLLTSTPETDASDINEFQTFTEKWKLSGLIPDNITMTKEHKEDFQKYFQKFDDVTRRYVILLLQKIAAGEITPTDPYNDSESGSYLNHCAYYLYDMNLDGFPEFILSTGGCEADRGYTFYTIADDELVECGGLSGSHAALYTIGSGKIVRYACHMGGYDITESILEETKFITREIADGFVGWIEGEAYPKDYPELREYGYDVDYDQYLEFIAIPELLIAPAG